MRGLSVVKCALVVVAAHFLWGFVAKLVDANCNDAISPGWCKYPQLLCTYKPDILPSPEWLCKSSLEPQALPNPTMVKVYGADWCGDCRRTKAYLESNKIDYEYIDLVQKPDQKEVAKDISGRQNIPVVVFKDGSFLVEPSDNELESKLKEL